MGGGSGGEGVGGWGQRGEDEEEAGVGESKRESGVG